VARSYGLTAVALAVLFAASLLVGAAELGGGDRLIDAEAWRLLALSRLPRTLAALLTGATMAVAGVIMQLLVRNRFVEPGGAGVSEAAMLGILVASLVSPGLSIPSKMAAASVAALASTALFVAMVRRLPPTMPLLVPLTGLVYGGVVGAAATFVAYRADLMQYLAVWMSGDFSGVLAGRYELLWLAGGLALLAYAAADQFTITGLGRAASLNLGLAYGQVMALGILMLSMVSALVVATVGLIPFVGLVAPNIVSRLLGDNLRATLPVVAGFGAGLVLAADLIGRIVRHSYEVPAGLVCGILGAGVFLWLLFSRPRRR
jgi:iron complex transport system permease protein